MKTTLRLCALGIFSFTICIGSTGVAAPLISALLETGTGLNANPAIATSASSPSPSGTSGALGDETFAYVTRTHEYTAVRTNDATGLLTNSTAAGTTQRAFPSYLDRLEYVQIAQENRAVADYSLAVTLAKPAKAYLFIDNRAAGTATNKGNTTDPTLTGALAWVVTDGWSRVNTGLMPNDVATGLPQADYLGIDEGATVANETLRVHTGAGNVAGSGQGLNQFFALYTKNLPAGVNLGVVKGLGNGGIDMFGLAVAAVPEPSAAVLALVGLAAACRRRVR